MAEEQDLQAGDLVRGRSTGHHRVRWRKHRREVRCGLRVRQDRPAEELSTAENREQGQYRPEARGFVRCG